MGCNIHLHIEIKIEGQWEHYGCPFMPRDYVLYGKMAGVRAEDIDPICPPKGFPTDATFITKIDYYRDYHHHASWFNIEEIRELELWFNQRAIDAAKDFLWYPGASWFLYLEQMTGYLFGNGFYKSEAHGIQDVRFVFWFDN
jgi:hypothetical protein